MDNQVTSQPNPSLLLLVHLQENETITHCCCHPWSTLMDDSSRVGLTLVFLRTSKAEIKCALGEIKNGNESPDILSTFITTQRCDIAHRPKVTHKVWAGGWHGWWKLLKGLALSGSCSYNSVLVSDVQAGRQRHQPLLQPVNRSDVCFCTSNKWPAASLLDGRRF